MAALPEVLDEEIARIRRGVAETEALNEDEIEALVQRIRGVKAISVLIGFLPYVDASGTKLVRCGKERTADREFVFCELTDLLRGKPRVS